MTTLLQATAFALGVYLAIRMVAAMYQATDLWYAIGQTYRRVIRGVLGWGATIFMTFVLLDAPYRTPLGWGLLAFPAFYLSLYVIRYPALWALERHHRSIAAAARQRRDDRA